MDEKDNPVSAEDPNVAVPVGTMPVDQFAPVLKTPLAGLASHVAFCERAEGDTATSADSTRAQRRAGPVEDKGSRRRDQHSRNLGLSRWAPLTSTQLCKSSFREA